MSVGLLKKPAKTLNANKKAKSTSCEMFEFPVAATAVPAGELAKVA